MQLLWIDDLMNKPRILIADDDLGIRFTISEIMKKEGYTVDEAEDGEVALRKALATEYDLIVLDVRMPKRDGIDALKEMRRQNVTSVVVVITAHGSEQLGMEAARSGAYDYFSKPFEIDELRIVVRRALERRAMEKQIQALRSKLVSESSYGNIIGQSPAMKRLYEMIGSVAPQDVTVLIRGESGSGKEVIAKEIHARSHRRDQSFVSINCAAIPESLLESELFGHERGAFTGAVAAKPGRFEIANGGTIFLDEIGDMPMPLQTKLLRVLQEREIQRVGGTKSIKTDIRVLAATNMDLEVAVEANRFRQDLFFRLNVIPIFLPPLRERPEDIPLLVRHFLDRFRVKFNKTMNSVDEEAMRSLVQYNWPGNVRELENALQRSVILARGDVLQDDDLPDTITQGKTQPLRLSPPTDATAWMGMDDDYLNDYSKPLAEKVCEMTDRLEKRAIELALKRSGGKREETAELLGLSRKSLYNKIAKLGIETSHK